MWTGSPEGQIEIKGVQWSCRVHLHMQIRAISQQWGAAKAVLNTLQKDKGEGTAFASISSAFLVLAFVL